MLSCEAGSSRPASGKLDCLWEDRVSQSVKADLVVALSRTTTPETIQFSESDVKNLVSSVNSDWVLRQRLEE